MNQDDDIRHAADELKHVHYALSFATGCATDGRNWRNLLNNLMRNLTGKRPQPLSLITFETSRARLPDDTPLTIAVDFDGTCVTHEWPHVGREIGATPVLRRMIAQGAQLILWTMRSGIHLQDALEWFTARDIPLYGVQRNPTQDTWTKSPKAYAHLYIDDAALGCPLIHGRSGTLPYVDWKTVESILWPAPANPSSPSPSSSPSPRLP
ncbi:MAG: hypothetical protein JJU00_14825 [Opitutales bacterium]|nr:hypothetical protein [Opitutales bacterium]